MPYESDVTVADIRDALDLPDGADEVISDDTIRLAIDSAESIVGTKADPDIPATLKRVAVIDIAAYRAFAAKQESVKDQKEAMDLVVSFDVEQLSTGLKQRRDDALELIGADGVPSRLHTLGDRRPYHRNVDVLDHDHHHRLP